MTPRGAKYCLPFFLKYELLVDIIYRLSILDVLRYGTVQKIIHRVA